MTPQRALLDACVLVPVTLAHTLLRVAAEELFQPRWSDEILNEVRFAIRRVHPPLALPRIERRITAMNAAFPEASISRSRWEPKLSPISLPDRDDDHVAAAAVASGCTFIVTMNLKDFPASTLHSLGLHAIHPDEFLLSLTNRAPDAVAAAIVSQAAALRTPPVHVAELLTRLENLQLTRFAAEIRRILRLPNTP